jgi:hypothetical protein
MPSEFVVFSTSHEDLGFGYARVAFEPGINTRICKSFRRLNDDISSFFFCIQQSPVRVAYQIIPGLV